MLWFCNHYIFNLEHTKTAKDVAMFFQEYVFELGNQTKNHLPSLL